MKSYKPTTKSQRHTTTVTYRGVLTASEPFKPLTGGFQRANGRNNYGRVTSHQKGGGHKRLFRDVDFKFNKQNIEAVVETVEYDPNRSGFLALVCYKDGERRYVLISKSVKVGDTFIVGENAPIKTLNRLRLSNIPVGTFIYNIEIKPGAGAVLVRSAGNFAEVIAQDNGFTLIKLPSTEVRKVHDTCYATIGEVSNEEHHLANFGKAGRSRWKGIRPKVRGTAMNPVDHPHGGGEGRQGRGLRRAKTRTGRPTGKGQKTRTPKKYSNKFVISRRKVGKAR
jgi:large subunit ribosomal protein L2